MAALPPAAIPARHRRSGAVTLYLPCSLPGGYYLVAAADDQGQCCEVELVLRADLPQATVLPPAPRDYLAEAQAIVDRVLAVQTRRLGERPDGTPFVTVGRATAIGYRSLGHRTGDSFATCWFPEEPFEYDACRADHGLWPILDELSRRTGEPRYHALAQGMLDALAETGFDPRSGLLYFSEESDLDVPRAAPRGKRLGDPPRFKPINSGPRTDTHLECFWQRLPRQTHRWLRATYYGLVTNPKTMDFNRFCMYGFDDGERLPALTPNSGHCGFETAAAGLILYWASCWAYAGDAECLEWARQMTAKWAAVQHDTSGLVPNFFGAVGWEYGAPQPPGQWAEARCAALTAPLWLQAAAMLRRRPGAEELAGQLHGMGRRLALGVARHAYDRERRVITEHLCLDGRPYLATARYCFRTQAEKDAAVRRDPQMAQVAVYDGAGFYRPPNYWEYCAGSNGQSG
jgi:hypothetical protein